MDLPSSLLPAAINIISLIVKKIKNDIDYQRGMRSIIGGEYIVRCQVSINTRTKDEEALYLMRKLSRLANTDASCDYGPRLPLSTPRIYTALSHATASTIMVSTST